jgi:hypothetical protein
MNGMCGSGAACVPPSQTFGAAGTVIGSLTPGSEMFYVLESDRSAGMVTLDLDLTNQ